MSSPTTSVIDRIVVVQAMKKDAEHDRSSSQEVLREHLARRANDCQWSGGG
jgi:hypothetical protein